MSVLLSRALLLSLVLSVSGAAMAQTPPASNGEPAPSRAQSSAPAPRAAQHEVYVGWGYNANRYANEDIEFTQPSLGNLFTLHDVVFHDSKGWTTGLFSKSLTGPEYNFQLGYYVRPRLAVELKFIHAKAIVTQDQSVHLTGTLGGVSADRTLVLDPGTLKYQLNNGANFVLFNAVHRRPLVREPGQTGSVALLLKAGAGFTVPHSENTVFGHPNEKGFGVSGPAVALEGALRVHAWRWIYGEVSEVGVWAGYNDLPVYEGRARQRLRSSTMTFMLGASLPLHHR